jgi:hypothetical protein
MKYREPTGDECNAKARVIAYTSTDGVATYGYACWYPQMGGYGGKCVVTFDDVLTEANDCFAAIVWHDGEFPFGRDADENPRVIHHCAADQFVRFGNDVEAMQAKHRPPKGCPIAHHAPDCDCAGAGGER